jgi:hypothetical protein
MIEIGIIKLRLRDPVKLCFAGLEIHVLRNYGKPHYEKLLKQKKKDAMERKARSVKALKLLSFYHTAKDYFLSGPCPICGSKIFGQKGCWFQNSLYFKLLILKACLILIFLYLELQLATFN